jgi:hypothetical protein
LEPLERAVAVAAAVVGGRHCVLRRGRSAGVLGPPDRLLHRRQHVAVRWKTVQVLLRHHLPADPHRELAPATFDQLRIDPSLLLDERRRTGSARPIISDLAVSNADALHDFNSM